MASCDNKTQQAFFQRLIDQINAPGQFSSDVHVRIEEIGVGYARGVLDVHPINLNLLGIVHGGCLATLADTVAGMGVVASGYSVVTANYGLNFLRPATGKQIRCIARAEKMGRTLCVMHVDLYNDDDPDHKVASGNFTFALLEPLDPENPFQRSNQDAKSR